jgi:hypothetical protein
MVDIFNSKRKYKALLPQPSLTRAHRHSTRLATVKQCDFKHIFQFLHLSFRNFKFKFNFSFLNLRVTTTRVSYVTAVSTDLQ